MMSDHTAVDTNVLVYLHDSSDEKRRKIAENILALNPNISSQVISEYLNVTRRLLDLPKTAILSQCAKLVRDCSITPMTVATLVKAEELINRYNFQLFDAVIVASALEANCSVLYSEDMQHGLKINNLTIVNPFI